MFLYIISFRQLIILFVQLIIHNIQFLVQSQKFFITLHQRPLYLQNLSHLNINTYHQQDQKKKNDTGWNKKSNQIWFWPGLLCLVSSINNRIELINFHCTEMNTGRNNIINSRLCKLKSVRQILFFVLYQCQCLQGSGFPCCVPDIRNSRHHQVLFSLIHFFLMPAEGCIRMSNHGIMRRPHFLRI